MRSFKSEFDRRGVLVAAVSFAEPAVVSDYQRRHQWPFLMLADPKRTAYEEFSLKRLAWFHVFSPATLKFYLKLFCRGIAREDWGKEDIYQGGGDFLLDRAGNMFFAHRSQDPADRPSTEKLLKELDRVG